MSTYETASPPGHVAQSTGLGTQVAERADAGAEDPTQRAREVSADAKDHAQHLLESAADQAKAVTSDMKEHAHDLVGQTRAVVTEEVDTQAVRIASSIDAYAQQLITLASRADDPDDAVAMLMRQAGDRMQAVARRIQARGPEGLLADVKRFARRRPGLFVFGAVGAGFVAGRLLRNVDRQALTDAVKGEDKASTDGFGFESAPAQPSFVAAAPSTTPLSSTSPLSSPSTPSSGSVVDLTNGTRAPGMVGDV